MPKRLVIDLDGTLTEGGTNYSELSPRVEVVEVLRRYKAMGFEIIIHTSRNMRTFSSSLGLITAKTVPVIIEWLNRNQIPFDELVVGKPWCGHEGFYVDDRAIRPSEFASMTLEQIHQLIRVSGPTDA
ncbi:MAG: capsular biosynthesis protein [Phycisphaerae bacterium]|nr:capsular biosynthesis protein [Phycisphaerae bacterium]